MSWLRSILPIIGIVVIVIVLFGYGVANVIGVAIIVVFLRYLWRDYERRGKKNSADRP